jgi:peptidylprolyl isomerase
MSNWNRFATGSVLVALMFVSAGCDLPDNRSSKKNKSSNAATADAVKEDAGMEEPKGSLQVIDEKVGDGPEAKRGKVVEVHYTGTLKDGKKFDSSLDRNQPFSFRLGDNQVIRGWEEGIVGMKVGGKRKLIIPSHLAYGKSGRPPAIPPSAKLTFEVELLNVK